MATTSSVNIFSRLSHENGSKNVDAKYTNLLKSQGINAAVSQAYKDKNINAFVMLIGLKGQISSGRENNIENQLTSFFDKFFSSTSIDDATAFFRDFVFKMTPDQQNPNIKTISNSQNQRQRILSQFIDRLDRKNKIFADLHKSEDSLKTLRINQSLSSTKLEKLTETNIGKDHTASVGKKPESGLLAGYVPQGLITANKMGALNEASGSKEAAIGNPFYPSVEKIIKIAIQASEQIDGAPKLTLELLKNMGLIPTELAKSINEIESKYHLA